MMGIMDGLTLAEIEARTATDDEMAADMEMMVEVTDIVMRRLGGRDEDAVSDMVLALVRAMPRETRLRRVRCGQRLESDPVAQEKMRQVGLWP